MSGPREYANEEAHLVYLPLDPGASDALRRLADWLDADEDRCLIGAWVLETDLQATVTTTRRGSTDD